MYHKKKVSKFKNIITQLKKLLKSNIPQSFELDYPRAVAPLFDNHHYNHAFL